MEKIGILERIGIKMILIVHTLSKFQTVPDRQKCMRLCKRTEISI